MKRIISVITILNFIFTFIIVATDCFDPALSEAPRPRDDINPGLPAQAQNETQDEIPAESPYPIGSIVTFGRYEQDNNSKNGKEPIEWTVIGLEADGTCLLLSKYALDYKPYNNSDTNVTWETCTLRRWMNTEFYSAAFDDSERQKILLTHNVTPDTPKYGTYGGADTYDYVFTLTLQEIADTYGVNHYNWEDWWGEPGLRGVATRYLKTKGVKTYDGYCAWWLRTPGTRNNQVVCISGKTGEFVYSNVTYKTDRGVRVAIRVRF